MSNRGYAIKATHFPAYDQDMSEGWMNMSRMTGRAALAATLLLCGQVVAVTGAEKAAVTAAPKAETAAVAPQPVPSQPAPYDRNLLRLSEILGSVHYLRGLCNPGGEDHWRAQMQKLLDLEAGKEPLRRQKFTAAFNHGYRSFASMHVNCTEAALAAEGRYRAEGATLAAEITARFGN